MTTDVTVDLDTGEVVDEPGVSHWRTGRWLKCVVHRQRSEVGGLRDMPVGVLWPPALAQEVVAELNARHSPFPWGPDVVEADTSAPMPDRG